MLVKNFGDRRHWASRFAQGADAQAATGEGAQLRRNSSLRSSKSRHFQRERSNRPLPCSPPWPQPINRSTPKVWLCSSGGRGPRTKVADVLASLARLGYVTSDDGGKTFAIRRVA
jgi:hypothetical protein